MYNSRKDGKMFTSKKDIIKDIICSYFHHYIHEGIVPPDYYFDTLEQAEEFAKNLIKLSKEVPEDYFGGFHLLIEKFCYDKEGNTVAEETDKVSYNFITGLTLEEYKKEIVEEWIKENGIPYHGKIVKVII